MEALVGHQSFSNLIVQKVSSDWKNVADSNVSIKKIWDIFSPFEIDPIIHKYSGGSDGRIIARHERIFSKNSNRSVTLHDHKFNVIATCPVYESCTDIFIYVCPNDDLRIVTTNGRLITYTGDRLVSNEDILVEEADIISVAFWDTGFVYLDKNYNLVSVPFFQNPKIIAEKVNTGIPTVFDVIPPAYTATGNPFVLISDSDGNLLVVSEDIEFSTKMPAPIISMAISPQFRFIAFIIEPMTLIITPITLDSLLFRMDIDEGDIFEQISWIGNDAPIITFDDLSIIVLNTGNTIEIPINGKAVVFSSSEHALILSSKSLIRTFFPTEAFTNCMATVSTISDQTNSQKNAPRTNVNSQQSALTQSITPASRLIDAFCNKIPGQLLLMKENHQLEDAIKDCIEAATQCDDNCESNLNFGVATAQTTLMMAACFGRSYLSHYQSDEFKNVTRALRLVNMFKGELNIIVTANELIEKVSNNGTDDIVSRLCVREFYSPAMEVADIFGSDKTLIVTHWCGKIINSVMDDDLAFNFIKQKFGQLFDSANVATIALSCVRMSLAHRIADSEKNRSLVIPFYMSAGLWDSAITAAASSCDSNLFIEVLRRAIETISEDEIVAAIGRDYFSYATVSKLIEGKKVDKTNINDNQKNSQRKNTRLARKKVTKKSNSDNPEENGQDNLEDGDKQQNENSDEHQFSKYIKKVTLTPALIECYVRKGMKAISEKTESEKVHIFYSGLKKLSIDFQQPQWLENLINSYKFYFKLRRIQNNLVREFNDISYNGLTLNQTMKKAADSHCLIKLLEIAKSEKIEITERKVISVIGPYFGKNGKFVDFKTIFSDEMFKGCYYLTTLIAVQYFNEEQVNEFISSFPDPKKQANIRESLNNNKFGDEIFGTKNLNCKLFKAGVMETLLA
ncbi:hypothetical protein TRFO_33803 [Tritrichomonas foetus]|uniref:Vps16 N-terminal domain-containing protein n=1 Tax=Tritrichomonas foetus TaxID=1144522 RepID=A0A1J4JR34_9EUKA|nr:hypothetical protein TRFO_33803 [Tritrichomonas foetus]|eukprot:OHS99724.1 hypothetical protein TRFO_33803 [Tritrichomonas foetus]